MQDFIRIDSNRREEFIDITPLVDTFLARAGAQNGICHLFCRHTTAGLTVNENYDPDVKRDLMLALDHAIPEGLDYRHSEGNSTAHVKAVLLGQSLTIPVQAGRLALGRWQGLLFAEFDGPRQGREVLVQFIAG
jgi:secondary thiamine-phosphate synthase enzyme